MRMNEGGRVNRLPFFMARAKQEYAAALRGETICSMPLFLQDCISRMSIHV